MSEQDPDDEAIEQETAVPLPERDAMTVIRGPQPMPVVGPDPLPITIDPPASE